MNFDKKTLILLRGIPGSGKTSFPNFLFHWISSDISVQAVSADDFQLNDTGEYVFKFENLAKCHSACRRTVRKAMEEDTDVIICDNTNTTEKELKPYVDMAQEHGYKLVSLISENRHSGQNVHGVPDKTLTKMIKRFSVKL